MLIRMCMKNDKQKNTTEMTKHSTETTNNARLKNKVSG